MEGGDGRGDAARHRRGDGNSRKDFPEKLDRVLFSPSSPRSGPTLH